MIPAALLTSSGGMCFEVTETPPARRPRAPPARPPRPRPRRRRARPHRPPPADHRRHRTRGPPAATPATHRRRPRDHRRRRPPAGDDDGARRRPRHHRGQGRGRGPRRRACAGRTPASVPPPIRPAFARRLPEDGAGPAPGPRGRPSRLARRHGRDRSTTADPRVPRPGPAGDRRVQRGVPGLPGALRPLGGGQGPDLRPGRRPRPAPVPAECQVAGRLSAHPNIVTVYDADLAPDGRPYISMELFERGSIGDRLRARAGSRSPTPCGWRSRSPGRWSRRTGAASSTAT